MDLSEVKACLRALLSSSAFGYTLRPLLQDFKNMTGSDLPLFGYKNPVEFLKTLTDTVQLIGDFYNPVVALVESEKSSHIISLVERQKNKKFNISNSYGRCLPQRLVMSFVQEPVNNSRNIYNSEGYNLSYLRNQHHQYQHHRGLYPVNNGNHILFRKCEEQRKNYLNPPPVSKNYPNYKPPAAYPSLRINQQENHYQAPVNILPNNMESQNVSKNLLNEFPEFLDPFPTTKQAENISELPKAPHNNSQETEKTDSCYFEDFSDIDSCLSGENSKSHPVKANSPPSPYINDGLKSKLKQIIKKFPDGLWCCELPDFFFKEFDVVLDYREFGCTSLIEMLSELPDVFRCIRPGNEDWILFDASGPPSEKEQKLMKLQENGNVTSDIATNLEKLLLNHCEHSADVGIELTEIPYLYNIMFGTPLDFQSMGFTCLKSFLETYEGSMLKICEIGKKLIVIPLMKTDTIPPVQWKEALPPITKDNDIFKEIFPHDVVGPEGNYPELDLSLHVAVGQRIEVCVAEVWSPSEFCIQLNKFRHRWNRFAADLQNFYNTHLNKYKMPDSTIIPQQLCVGLYSEDSENPDEWNRAKILKVINERIVMVEFVDFGTVARVKKTQLRFLHRNFQSLPVQAFVAGLHNLAPKDGDLWSMKASKKFLELSRVPFLEAELVDIDFKKPLLKVVLYDPSQKPHVNINKQLITENLAKPIETKVQLFKFDPEEPETQQDDDQISNAADGTTFSVVSDEFSDASDLECHGYTALFHFKMKSRKASDDKRTGENKEKGKPDEIVDEFEEVPDWDKIVEKPNIKGTVGKEKSVEADLFDVKEEPLPPKPNSNSGSAKSENDVQEGMPKRLPPGLEHMAELNRFRMLPLEQPDEIKKKINILAVELMTTNPSIKQVAVQDPTLALKIASEMAEVYVRWMCYDINPFGTNYFQGTVMPESPFLVPLPMPFPEAGIYPPVAGISPAPSEIQLQKDLNTTSTTNILIDAVNDKSIPSCKTGSKNKYVRVEKIGGKNIHVTTFNGQVYFFAEELIRTFSTFTNRDVADRVLHLKKVVVEYKILNKSNGEKILTEIKSFDIPGVFKKKSKKWNVYLIPAEIVIKFLHGLGCETKSFENDIIRFEKTARDKETKTKQPS